MKIRLPLDLHDHFNVLPGTTFVIGGSTNAGKTLLGFNMLRLILEDLSTSFENPLVNNKFKLSLRESSVRAYPENSPFPQWTSVPKIRFLNSEMSEHELVSNLNAMGPAKELLRDNVEWIRRGHDYPRAVVKDGITLCDFLQIHTDFYEIGGIVADMADRVGNGLLIILIQKKSGEAAPRGGDFALERCRVAMMLDYAGPGISSLSLRKVKYPANPRNNPQGMEIDFRIGPNLTIQPASELRRLTKKQRETVNASYQREFGQVPAEEEFKGQF
jgi:hypothetical protein